MFLKQSKEGSGWWTISFFKSGLEVWSSKSSMNENVDWHLEERMQDFAALTAARCRQSQDGSHLRRWKELKLHSLFPRARYRDVMQDLACPEYATALPDWALLFASSGAEHKGVIVARMNFSFSITFTKSVLNSVEINVLAIELINIHPFFIISSPSISQAFFPDQQYRKQWIG